MMLRLGVLLSGGGTNLQAIIDAIASGFLDAEIVLVVSSRSDAYGLKRAAAAGIPTIALSGEVYADPALADRLIAAELARAGVEYVVMAGYMRRVTEPILTAFPDRVLNIHPALLPSFAGAHGIADAFHAGVKLTGVTVHFADAAYDRGPIIAQRAIPIEEDDTLEALEERVHAVEHLLYPEVLQWLAAGRVSINDQRHVCIGLP
ncbi:MAG: phosphoribosylglycinamide formyltransferase [Coriobacteriales bacterium]|jgi:phosphoribosylglycinamide formyltransferase-1|nr:phosphoribosylglycinamide formyltransferase [Coriobacteriales bacterium]